MQDSRFSRVLKDPRFIRPKKKQSKVIIDDRFKDMFTDAKFTGYSACKIDKFGRSIKSTTPQSNDTVKSLKRFYQLENEEDKVNDISNYDPARGEGVLSSSSDSEDEHQNNETEESFDCNPAAINRESFTMGDATSRLAFVNLDWDNIQPQDLYQLANSFKSPIGHIKSVKIYYSLFGKERIAHESIYGPPSNIFKNFSTSDNDSFGIGNEGYGSITKNDEEFQSDQEEQILDQDTDVFYSESDTMLDKDNGSINLLNDNSDSDEGSFKDIQQYNTETQSNNEPSQLEQNPDDIRKADYHSDKFVNAKTSEEFDEDSLRRYQLERLRYCYAIVETDSVATAEAIYSSCDGQEFEKTCNIIDVRFVPEDQIFSNEDLIPNGVCVKPSEKYSPLDFTTLSLMHSKVSLTWDADDQRRTKITKARFSQDALDEMDFKAYLASSDDEGSENEENEMKKEHSTKELLSIYRKLSTKSNITTTSPFNSKSPKDLFNDDELKEDTENISDIDMEMTFLQDDSDDKLPHMQESVFQAQLRKEKERKQKKREARKGLHSEHLASSKQKDEKPLSLMIDKDDILNENSHFNMNEIVKREKTLLKRSSKKSKNTDPDTVDTFDIQLDDPRFSEVYTSHSYSIDPSHPNFKNTTSMRKLLATKKDKRSTKL